ncbi:hypothetical protein LTR74_018822, partial [Friedmanniomyces endolithicus]
FAETSKELAAQKAEVEHLECVEVEDMLREDKEYRALAGTNPDEAIVLLELEWLVQLRQIARRALTLTSIQTALMPDAGQMGMTNVVARDS